MDSQPTEQRTVFFSGDYVDDAGFQLVEVSEDFLTQLGSGHEFSWKAEPGLDEEVVLCSKEKTFPVRRVESSNSVYVVKASSDSALGSTRMSLSTQVHGHLELIPARGRTGRLQQVLEQYAYPTFEESVGDDNDANADSGGNGKSLGDEPFDRLAVMRRHCSWDGLRTNTAASDAEIRLALDRINAVEREGGVWRVIADKHVEEVLNFFLHTCIQHDWDLQRISPELAVESIPEYPPWLVRAIVSRFTLSNPDSDVRSINARSLLLFRALRLFSSNERWRYDEFMHAWGDSLPEGFALNPKVLNGVAIYEMSGPEKVLIYFPVERLPHEPRDRFQALFRARARWPADEIAPYLSDLVGPSESAEPLLLKYTRNAVVDGCRCYFARELSSMTKRK